MSKFTNNSLYLSKVTLWCINGFHQLYRIRITPSYENYYNDLLFFQSGVKCCLMA